MNLICIEMMRLQRVGTQRARIDHPPLQTSYPATPPLPMSLHLNPPTWHANLRHTAQAMPRHLPQGRNPQHPPRGRRQKTKSLLLRPRPP